MRLLPLHPRRRRAALQDLFALRRADDAASGAVEPALGGLDELRARVGAELASHPLTHRQLAVRGTDLIEALGIGPGPVVGSLLRRLMEAVLDDPLLNDRASPLSLAREWLPSETVVRRRTTQRPVARGRASRPGPGG